MPKDWIFSKAAAFITWITVEGAGEINHAIFPANKHKRNPIKL